MAKGGNDHDFVSKSREQDIILILQMRTLKVSEATSTAQVNGSGTRAQVCLALEPITSAATHCPQLCILGFTLCLCETLKLMAAFVGFFQGLGDMLCDI